VPGSPAGGAASRTQSEHRPPSRTVRRPVGGAEKKVIETVERDLICFSTFPPALSTRLAGRRGTHPFHRGGLELAGRLMFSLGSPGSWRRRPAARFRFQSQVEARPWLIAARARRPGSAFGRGDKPHRRWKRRCAHPFHDPPPGHRSFQEQLLLWRAGQVLPGFVALGESVVATTLSAAIVLSACRRCATVACGPWRCVVGLCVDPACAFKQLAPPERSELFIGPALGRKTTNSPSGP